MKLSIVYEAVSQPSRTWDCLRAGRQASSLGLLGEGDQGGDRKPEYRPGWRGLASSNGDKPVGRAYADVHLMAVIHQKEAQPLCWEGEGAATLIQPGMTLFSPYVPSVFHQREGWLICLYTPEVISTPKESPQQPTILWGHQRARLICQREEVLISSWYHSGRDYMSRCVDGKRFGGVSCNSHILILVCFVVLHYPVIWTLKSRKFVNVRISMSVKLFDI